MLITRKIEKKLLQLIKLRNAIAANQDAHRGVHQNVEKILSDLDAEIEELRKKI